MTSDRVTADHHPLTHSPCHPCTHGRCHSDGRRRRSCRGHTVLREINLTIAPGEHVAIVGPSRAGKSSLAGLLLGWLRPAAGQLWLRPAAGQLWVDGAPLQGTA
jgi:ABC-type multidrug transport system fused ATPase/permease subunit